MVVSGQRRRKAQLRELLTQRDFDQLRTWAAEDPNILRGLTGLLFDRDSLACWQAVEGLGHAASVQAGVDLERVRRLISSQFWHMNDESGNVGWFAAEAVGETLHAVPALIPEFGAILPSFFQEEPFERGSHWAVARIASAARDFYKPHLPLITKSLGDTDPNIRLYSLWALNEIGIGLIKGCVREMSADKTPVTYYSFITGSFETTTVGQAAESILLSFE
jgi:hypothetical protein